MQLFPLVKSKFWLEKKFKNFLFGVYRVHILSFFLN